MKLTLAQWRRAKNITQEEMAKACGVHINTYRNWERSPTEIKIGNLEILVKQLGIEVSDIDFTSGQ